MTMADDDCSFSELINAISEREAVADGRPNVYTRPILPSFSNVSGRRQATPLFYKDRLLLALRRAHGRPRYDLVVGG
jgi:hypothetical protein